MDYNIVSKSGAWYSYGGTRLAQGREATIALLKDNPEMAEEIENKIKQAAKEETPVDKKKTTKTKAKEKSDDDSGYEEPDDDFDNDEEDDE